MHDTRTIPAKLVGRVISAVEVVYLNVQECLNAQGSPVVTLCTTRFNIHRFFVLPTQCIYVFCVDLRTNSDYFPIQH